MSGRLLSLLRSTFTNQSIQVAAWAGSGGVALAVANLLYAAILDPEDFGRLVLFEAVVMVGSGLSLLGLDLLAARSELPRTWRTQQRTAKAVFFGAVAAGVVALFVYGFTADTALLIAAASFAGAVARITAGFDQAELRFNRSQIVVQLPYLVFLTSAGVLLALDRVDWKGAAATLALGFVLSAAFALWIFGRSITISDEPYADTAYASFGELFRKAQALFGIAAVVLVLLSLERLLIPQLLSLSELATYGVVATLVASPYRVLRGGITYTLLPNLRRATSKLERRGLIRAEVGTAAVLGVGGGAILLLGAGPLIHLLYGGKYFVSWSLVAAIVFSGCANLVDGVGSATVSALGEQKLLMRFNVGGWIAAGVAVASASALRGFGLVGIVLGTSTGWLFRIGVAYIVLRSAPPHTFSARPDPAKDEETAASARVGHEAKLD